MKGISNGARFKLLNETFGALNIKLYGKEKLYLDKFNPIAKNLLQESYL